MGTEEGLRELASDILHGLVGELEAEVAMLRGKIPKWIPVSERLPEPNQYVWGYSPGLGGEHIYGTGFATYGGIRWRYSANGPTHWMPLPEPPATVTEQT